MRRENHHDDIGGNSLSEQHPCMCCMENLFRACINIMKIFPHRADDFWNPNNGRRQIFAENENFPDNFLLMKQVDRRCWYFCFPRTRNISYRNLFRGIFPMNFIKLCARKIDERIPHCIRVHKIETNQKVEIETGINEQV